jgi:hypothetical protein
MKEQFIELTPIDASKYPKVLVNVNHILTSMPLSNGSYIIFSNNTDIRVNESYECLTDMIRNKPVGSKPAVVKSVDKPKRAKKVNTWIKFLCEDKYVHQFDYLDLVMVHDEDDNENYVCIYDCVSRELTLRYSNHKYLTNNKRNRLNPIHDSVYPTKDGNFTDYKFKISKLVWQGITKQIKEIIEQNENNK